MLTFCWVQLLLSNYKFFNKTVLHLLDRYSSEKSFDVLCVGIIFLKLESR